MIQKQKYLDEAVFPTQVLLTQRFHIKFNNNLKNKSPKVPKVVF